MIKSKLSDRVDFTYLIGAIVSLILFNLTMAFYKGAGLPMIFSMVCFFSYTGVIIRGLVDPGSWGKTQRQKKVSAFVGFTSIFVIFSIESVLLLTQSFKLPGEETTNIFVFGGFGITLLYILIYTLWFRKITYQELENS